MIPLDERAHEAADAVLPSDTGTDKSTDFTNVGDASVNLDALYKKLMDRAGAIAKGSLGAVDALMADVVQSVIPEAAFKSIATVAAKASGLDEKEITKKLLRARGARLSGAESNAAPVITPHPAPDRFDIVLDRIESLLRRQVWATDDVYVAGTLWIACTYGYTVADLFPRLAITSETKRCGKSTLLRTTYYLTFSAKYADNISPAAMFRLIANHQLTLCIDEVDSFIKRDTDHRNILNAGYERMGTVTRCVPTPNGKDWEVVDFPCYCPVALAGIGGVPETVLDRSIILRLQRAERGQHLRPLRHRELRDEQAAIVPHLLAHRPPIEAAAGNGLSHAVLQSRQLVGLSPRALDNWEPLLAVAAVGGSRWLSRSLDAARRLEGSARPEKMALAEQLLEDVRFIINAPRREAIEAFQTWKAAGRSGTRPVRLARAQRPTHIASVELADLLGELKHRPWATISRGQPVTESWIANRLHGFDVHSRRRGVAAWDFDVNGAKRRTLGAYSPQLRTLPRRMAYELSALAAVCRRVLGP
jgi:putative DNA primase/helicase